MSLSGTEWAVLHTLHNERNEIDVIDSEERWNISPDKMKIVREWIESRIKELEEKKQ